MQLKTLATPVKFLKLEFMEAVKSNATLRLVTAYRYRHDPFAQDELHQLRKFAARNQGLASWINAPTSVPEGAWANALAAVQDTGPFPIFSILVKILGPIADPSGSNEDCERATKIRRLSPP